MLTYYLFCAVATVATELAQAFALSFDFVPMPGATSRLGNLQLGTLP